MAPPVPAAGPASTRARSAGRAPRLMSTTSPRGSRGGGTSDAVPSSSSASLEPLPAAAVQPLGPTRGRRGRGRTRQWWLRRVFVDGQDRLPDRDPVARLHLDIDHQAGYRRRHFNRGLVGLEFENRLLLRDHLARLDQHTQHVARRNVLAQFGESEVSRHRSSPPQSARLIGSAHEIAGSTFSESIASASIAS